MTHYENLGVPKSADRATIKKAYRKKAQKLHPDRQGGNVEAFHAVQLAYDVLYDDARRAHYDATGADGQPDRQGELMKRLAALFMHFLETADADHADLITLMRQALLDGKNKTQQSIRQQEQKIVKLERTKKRLKKKGGGENLFVQMIDAQISMFKRGIELGKTEIEMVGDMIKIVADYEYSPDGGGNYATMQSLMGIAASDVFGGNARW